jgi:hypothetical protein
MTRLALVVVVWLPSVVLFADDPKKPPTELEGVWQEPARPGEDAALRYKITFAAEKVTIHHREQVLTGTLWVDTRAERITVAMVITGAEGKGSLTKGIYSGIYQVEKERVSLRFNPHPVDLDELPDSAEERTVFFQSLQFDRGRDPATLGLAPFTLTLHKVKK